MALSDIETVVVVIMENRSFDHMLGTLSQPSLPNQMAADGIIDEQEWLSAHANMFSDAPYQSHPLDPSTPIVPDPQHHHLAAAVQINTPAADPNLKTMGGFVQSYVQFCNPAPPDPSLVMGYFDMASLPVYAFFAEHFTVCDRWFSAIPTCTQPNRLMAMGGESLIFDNAKFTLPDQPLVYDWLTSKGVTWCAYQKGGMFPFFTLMPKYFSGIISSLTASAMGERGEFRRYSDFAEQWVNDLVMPSVVFIEPAYSEGPLSDPCDDHAPTGVAKGQAFLADVYQNLLKNPKRWAKTIMIITYDENGGFFDHVDPLPIQTPIAGTTHVFQTTGMRVPAFVISPQVRPGYVFSGNLDHTSILQFLDDRFSPGAGYSEAVNARQPYLDRLLNVLIAPSDAPPLEVPADVLARVAQAAQSTPPTPPSGAAPGDPANAQALHNVALRFQAEHPELLSQPAWREVNAYLSTVPAAQPGH